MSKHNQRGRKAFRDGSYYASVAAGKRTVKEGECAAIWTASGSRKLVTGPQRVRLWWSHVRFLDRYVADSNQYLVVQFRTGRTENHRGPRAMFLDPCIHEKVQVYDAYRLAANEALVVYSECFMPAPGVLLPTPTDEGKPLSEPDAGGRHSAEAVEGAGAPLSHSKVQRRIVHGPAIFSPSADEWVHTFSWHGSLHNGKGSKTGTLGDEKLPHALSFQKIRCMPDQMYYSVPAVRTSDDAQLTVHGMIFYELLSIETMLDTTNDPIGDFVNAASADVMVFASSLAYETLMNSASELSELSTFPILAQRMAQTGFRLLKVVYRGYSTSSQLQSMHDEAIAKRTKLRLTSDTVEVEQAQQAIELRCKMERSEQEKQIEEASKRHVMRLQEMEMQAEASRRDAEHAQALRHKQEESEAALAQRRLDHDEELRRLGELQQLGVDLTKMLVAELESVPDQHVRIDAQVPPTVHFDAKPRKGK